MPTAGLDAVSKVLAEPATVWLAFANLNAPPFAMSAKFQSPPGSADRAVACGAGLGCTRGAAATGGGTAGGWARGAAAHPPGDPDAPTCDRRPRSPDTRPVEPS